MTGRPGEQRLYRRPDASMSLLTRVFEHAMDDGYAAARAHRIQAPAGQPKLRGLVPRRVAFAALLAACALLATAGIRQLVATEPQAAVDHAALVREAKERSAVVDRLRDQITDARAGYAGAQRRALASGTAGSAEIRRLDTLQRLSGLAAVTGEGVRVRVDDAESGEATGVGEGGRVRDRDLQLLVNGLWAAGATAISINGHRLTSLTAIREAGDAVTVDYRPLSRPYMVKAIGDPNALQTGFASSPAGRYFKTLQTSFDVRFAMSEHDDLKVPAASEVALHYAQPKESP
ncbi:MAG: DUF881 domain-containing protein [Streptosporangiales bacterium]